MIAPPSLVVIPVVADAAHVVIMGALMIGRALHRVTNAGGVRSCRLDFRYTCRQIVVSRIHLIVTLFC